MASSNAIQVEADSEFLWLPEFGEKLLNRRLLKEILLDSTDFFQLKPRLLSVIRRFSRKTIFLRKETA
jgi:hypothetical protein